MTVSPGRAAVPMIGIGHAGREGVSFPDALFVPDDKDLCAESRRSRMAEQDGRVLAEENWMIMFPKDEAGNDDAINGDGADEDEARDGKDNDDQNDANNRNGPNNVT